MIISYTQIVDKCVQFEVYEACMLHLAVVSEEVHTSISYFANVFWSRNCYGNKMLLPKINILYCYQNTYSCKISKDLSKHLPLVLNSWTLIKIISGHVLSPGYPAVAPRKFRFHLAPSPCGYDKDGPWGILKARWPLWNVVNLFLYMSCFMCC